MPYNPGFVSNDALIGFGNVPNQPRAPVYLGGITDGVADKVLALSIASEVLAHEAIIVFISTTDVALGGANVASLVDSSGNVYTFRSNTTVVVGGVNLAMNNYECMDAVALAAGATITLTTTANDAQKAIMAYKLPQKFEIWGGQAATGIGGTPALPALALGQLGNLIVGGFRLNLSGDGIPTYFGAPNAMITDAMLGGGGPVYDMYAHRGPQNSGGNVGVLTSTKSAAAASWVWSAWEYRLIA